MQGSRRIQRLKARTRSDLQHSDPSQKKAVGYIRVSTEDQAQKGHGLESQEHAIRAFAESQGYDLIRIISDAGVSGATKPELRPGFQEVFELAKARAFSILLVWKFDRLARSLLYSVITVHELREVYAVVLRSVTEPIDTGSPMGEMIFAVLASFAAEERRTITRRTIAGKKEKSSQGGFSGGAAPLGYARGPEGRLLIEDREVATVLLIHALKNQGRGLRAIAAHLNTEGILSKRGGKWYAATVRYILDNPKYRGLIEYYFQFDGEQHVLREGLHSAILPEAA